MWVLFTQCYVMRTQAYGRYFLSLSTNEWLNKAAKCWSLLSLKRLFLWTDYCFLASHLLQDGKSWLSQEAHISHQEVQSKATTINRNLRKYWQCLHIRFFWILIHWYRNQKSEYMNDLGRENVYSRCSIMLL